MSAGTDKKRRVVVAGTAFGRIYLDAVASARDSFTLAGVLARGSEYSRECAERYGAPLYTRVEDIPDDVDIACVVVRSGATGGAGSDIARALLGRGIHVLQEHPVHATEITACLKAAKQGGAAYAVNTLYPNVRPIRQFLAVAEHLRKRQRIQFIDAACNSQVAYPLLDVLGRAAGDLRPWSFSGCAPRGDRSSSAAGQPFQSLSATIGGVPVTLRVQNQVHPEDPDNHSLLMHRIALGCDAGVLTLADTHGPVLWNPRLHSPRDPTGRLIMSGPGTERLAVESTSILGDQHTRSYHDVFARTWPDAVVVALHDLCRDIADPARRVRSGQWALGVSLAWRDMTERIGMPELIRPETPEPLPVDELRAAARAAVDEAAPSGAR
ncbi:thiazolinyl imide reductase [Sorangium cellulosum]|uniref:Thiazolinyl imide reductase n=1 Tax=Sorangium cellulosum TaxID=56 RepID=A0A150P2X6_SORCE|nr:thiazolinyl imide reductase [Sorangium cellulosum]